MLNIKIFLLLACISVVLACGSLSAQDYVAELISAQGQVEIRAAGTSIWTVAQDFQQLYPRDTIQTGKISRAAILFIDQTQIKLNENTTLELKDIKLGTTSEISWGRTARSLFNLVSGEIWIRSGGELLDLQVDTPIASATIRGTEFVVQAEKKKTTVTVINGKVSLKNSQGEVVIDSGEQGVAEINKPPYKTVIINPEDAVQWSLYYPGNICRQDYAGISTEELTVIEEFLILYQEKKLAEAIDLVSQSLKEIPNSACLFTQLAFGQLLVGQVKTAEENLEKALAIDPDFSLAHSILSNIYLVQNNKEKALPEAELAIASNPDSPSAYVSLAWVRQSQFDIPGAITACRQALALDDRNVQALVTLCRLLFGSDEIKESTDIIDHALVVAPRESVVNATKGFLLLAEGETEASVSYFELSIRQDSSQGLGHLGLGLAEIRLKNIARGLKEMLIATLLEPKVSLYQSYLGKAYYQVAKEYAKWGVSAQEGVNYTKYIQLAEKNLQYAIYLDPRDPTPFLYGGIMSSDLNQPVAAIEKLNQSIALNDNRAVYRSRLLLDQDRATENISLAQAYDTLGLAAWGSQLALRSYQADYNISGAHRFLGSTYLRLRGRTRAAGSELLQARLLMPVNENSFNTYNNYTSLFETPEYNGRLSAKIGEEKTREYNTLLNGGTGKYAFTQSFAYEKEDGYLAKNDDAEYTTSLTMLKYAIADRSHLYGSFAAMLQDQGDHAYPWAPWDNDPNLRFKGQLYELALGYYQQFNPDTDLLIYTKSKQDKYKYRDENYSAAQALTNINWATDTTRFWNGQIELIKRIASHQFVCAVNCYNGRETYSSQTFYPGGGGEKPPGDKVPQKYTVFLLRDYWKLSRLLELDLALRYDDGKDGRTGYDKAISTADLNPQAGLVFIPFENTTIRGAVIKSTQRYFEDNILPTNTAGFIIDHNELSSSRNTEYGLAWDQIIGEKTFFTVSGSYRERKVPELTANLSGSEFILTRKDKFTGANFTLNRILCRYLALAGEYSFLKIDDQLGKRDDQQVKLRFGFVHPSGWAAEVTETYTHQENEKFVLAAPFDSSFWITDLAVSYEFPKKRGKLTLAGENLFDKKFKYVSDRLTLDDYRPDRRVTVKAEIFF